jgi:GT2 family glycosyltransferase
MTTVLSVNFNTPELLLRMINSFRQFHGLENKIVIVDGSNKYNYDKLKDKISGIENIEIHHFAHNIHHGPGMAYGITTIDSSKILVLDSDIIVYKRFLCILEDMLEKSGYGIGDVQLVNKDGWNIGGYERSIKKEEYKTGIAYLHPACMLINREVALQWPMPIKHGAPMITPMVSITEAGKTDLLQHCDWIFNDFRREPKQCIRHDWQGTVNLTGGYHL